MIIEILKSWAENHNKLDNYIFERFHEKKFRSIIILSNKKFLNINMRLFIKKNRLKLL